MGRLARRHRAWLKGIAEAKIADVAGEAMAPTRR